MRISTRFRIVLALLCTATLSGRPFGANVPTGPAQDDEDTTTRQW